MAFPARAEEHAEFMASHIFGETIEYLPSPAGAYEVAFTAIVRRAPVDRIGDILTNVIHVYVPKSKVTRPTLGEDRIRLAQEEPGDTQAVYTVRSVLEEGIGHYWLEAIR